MSIKHAFPRLRTRAVVVLAAFVTCVAVGPFAAHAAANGQDDEPEGVFVTWTRSPKPGGPAGTTPTPVCLPDKQCVVTAQGGHVVLDGDLMGEAIGGSAYGQVVPGQAYGAVAIYAYALTASPCGTGSVVFMSMNTSSGEPNTAVTGRWEIAAGVGTGDLKDMRGQAGRLSAPTS